MRRSLCAALASRPTPLRGMSSAAASDVVVFGDMASVMPSSLSQGVDASTQVCVGREAPLGSGYADVLWLDVEGRLTVIEVKLDRIPRSGERCLPRPSRHPVISMPTLSAECQ